MVVIAPPEDTVHQTLSTNTSELVSLTALVEGLIHYLQTEADIDAKVAASSEVVNGTIATLETTLTNSINLVNQTSSANASAIQSNVTALSEQVSRLAATESALSQQDTLNQQQQIMLDQLSALTSLLESATDEQAQDIVDNLFSSQISLGGTSVDLRYLLFFKEAIQVWKTTRVATANWPGDVVYQTSWNIPEVGSELRGSGKILGGNVGGEYAELPDQTTFPIAETGPDYVKVVYEINDAFGLPGVLFEHETVFRKKDFSGKMLYVPTQIQDLTYGGGTTALLALLVSTYGEPVKAAFFPAPATETSEPDPDPANA